MVQSLLAAYPAAVHARCAGSLLPLHYAALFGAAPAVVQHLLDSAPQEVRSPSPSPLPDPVRPPPPLGVETPRLSRAPPHSR